MWETRGFALFCGGPRDRASFTVGVQCGTNLVVYTSVH